MTVSLLYWIDNFKYIMILHVNPNTTLCVAPLMAITNRTGVHLLHLPLLPVHLSFPRSGGGNDEPQVVPQDSPIGQLLLPLPHSDEPQDVPHDSSGELPLSQDIERRTEPEERKADDKSDSVIGIVVQAPEEASNGTHLGSVQEQEIPASPYEALYGQQRNQTKICTKLTKSFLMKLIRCVSYNG